MGVLVSIVYLVKNGGPLFERSLEAVFSQRVSFEFEVIAVDSGSTDGTLDLLKRYPVRVYQIEPAEFNFGLTRDYGFSLAKGDILIALSQDAIPVGTDWLTEMVVPFADASVAVVQGMDVLPTDRKVFYWDAVGLFYHTRECREWLARHGGVGVSFTSCAVRREVWEANRLGFVEMSEDKVFQKMITAKGLKIVFQRNARDYHSHWYGVRSLAKRCENEGLGWRLVGQTYSFPDMLRDLLSPRVHKALFRGVVGFNIRSWAEALFPILRPVYVYKGNRLGRKIRRYNSFETERYITSASDIPSDLTRHFDYGRLVEEEIEEYNNIEVTDDLREGGIHAHKAWGYWFKYLAEQVWHTSFGNEVETFCNGMDNPRILSLGCGYGGYDLSVARSLKKPYELIAVDLNGNLFKEARKEAERQSLNIRFEAVDLNFVKIKENSFDLVYAHASLHHILNLENLFFQIHRGLKAHGRLIVQDIIGKTRVLFWPENIKFALKLVKEMPAKYKAGVSNPDDIVAPDVSGRRWCHGWSAFTFKQLKYLLSPRFEKGMEGIRQEEIEEQISRYFVPVRMFKYGSFMRLICTNERIGKLFDPDVEEDRKYLEYLFSLDLKQVREKKLRPTEMFAVFEKRERTSP